MTTQTTDYEHITVEALAEIRRAFVENLVIFFRDQDITPEQHKAFARHFGELHVNDFFPRVEGHEDVQLIVKEPDESKNVGEVWHSDVTYKKRPALGSLLYAKEVPPYGGDTMFANMYLAYETLSPGMQALLRRLKAAHSAGENFARRAAETKGKGVAFQYSENAEQDAVHPAIRTHPESGRDALYVNRSFTKNFAGMTREESAPILGFLFDHLKRPEFTCRLRWRAGTLAFWDNRCAQHFAINDYHGHRRLMNRVTVLGDEPFLAERPIADAA